MCVLIAVVMLIEVDKQKTDGFTHMSETYVHVCTWMSMCAHGCPCASRHYMCALHVRVCVRCYYCIKSSKVLCKQPRETCKLTQAMKARQKSRLTGPTTGCWTNKASCIEEKQTVRQTALVYTQHSKQTRNKYMYIHIHTVCLFVCMLV